MGTTPNPAGLLVTVVKDNNTILFSTGDNGWMAYGKPTNKFNNRSKPNFDNESVCCGSKSQHYAIMQGMETFKYTKALDQAIATGLFGPRIQGNGQSYTMQRMETL